MNSEIHQLASECQHISMQLTIVHHLLSQQNILYLNILPLDELQRINPVGLLTTPFFYFKQTFPKHVQAFI